MAPACASVTRGRLSPAPCCQAYCTREEQSKPIVFVPVPKPGPGPFGPPLPQLQGVPRYLSAAAKQWRLAIHR